MLARLATDAQLTATQKLWARVLAVIALSLAVAGCASSVRTQLNTFMSPGATFGEGSIAVQPADPSQQDSLEFQHYKSQVESYLTALGYTLAPPEQAGHIAQLGFRVDEIQANVRQPEVVFTTGFGSYYRRGGVGFMWGEGGEYEDAFLHRITLAIARRPGQVDSEPRRIYEVTALSEGECAAMSVVFDEMLAAIFQEFPGDNGAVKTVTVDGEADCP